MYVTGIRPVTATKVPTALANGSKDARARKAYVPATTLEQAFRSCATDIESASV